MLKKAVVYVILIPNKADQSATKSKIPINFSSLIVINESFFSVP